MEVKEAGVLAPSYLEFLAPSKFAKQVLLYTPQYGRFYCDEKYFVRRDSLDLYLLCFIDKGQLEFSTQNERYTASEGDVVLLDCHEPHSYYSEAETEFQWIHFNGTMAEAYVHHIFEKTNDNIIFTPDDALEMRELFNKVLNWRSQAVTNEHQISVELHQILAELAQPKQSQLMSGDHPVSVALNYVQEHYAESIDVELLASLTHMSRYHFIRVFKRHINSTPHEYLVIFRLKQAKQLLQTTLLTNEEIAFRCGFNSASHFARSFRSHHKISPQAFRKVHF